MPYIRKEVREFLKEYPHGQVSNVGELNYFLTTSCLKSLGSKPAYSDFNAIIGVLECVKFEMYRRMVAPYEDLKCKENGDVYPSE